jgi:hypothetical protein
MAHWNPATLPAVEQVVKPVFIGVLLPGCVPNPVPGVFYVTLELACIAGWLAGGAIPGSLLPTFIPASFVPPPVPGALAVALLPTVPLGLASPTKHPVRIAIGTIIDVWTRLWFVTAPGSPPVLTPFL